MTLVHKEKSDWIRKIFLHAIRIPLVYFFIGSLLIALSYIDNFFPLTKYKNIFDVTDQVGKIILSFALLGFAYRFTVLMLLHEEQKIHNRVAALIMASIRKGLRIILWLAVIDIVITFLGPAQAYLSLANDLLKTIMIGAIGWIVLQTLYTFEAIIDKKIEIQAQKDRRAAKALYTKVHILRNIATVLVILLTIAAILMSFQGVRNIGISLLASAGVATAILGLAAQKPLFSLFSGLHIALSQPIKIGDVVVVENQSGTIEEITFTYVIIKLDDNRRMIVPISYFLDKQFENWSRDPDGMQSTIHLYVDYLMPIQPLREQLDKILANSSFWDKNTGKLTVGNISERSVEINLQVSADNATALSNLKAEIREQMLAFIQGNYPDYFPQSRSLG